MGLVIYNLFDVVMGWALISFATGGLIYFIEKKTKELIKAWTSSQ